ncbi:rod shape-determining protein MreD [Parerythrobacter jejuensis]|uniref:Rod shape-determining protein MreD n=1 Tax=Parerythrobacter jejuensis TaxID=795812 RepID=A0A845APR5_9SPHN|nr:rod shape-determining protein MreD [Parerythrobacter jejuensis]MXP32300.1 rod shape-determining protein MreD [Parerythrobacter jejuensis]
MEQLNPRSRSDAYGSRINRDHSPLLLYIVPWGSILLACLLPFLPLTSAIPILPPLGLLFLLAWRLVRPGLMPVWAGFPLGLWNDLFSGQPFGCSILLFSVALLAIEAVEARFPWRSFRENWITAGLVIAVFLVVGMAFSGGEVTFIALIALGPQLLLSILAFPPIARLVAGLDRFRLVRIRVVG